MNSNSIEKSNENSDQKLTGILRIWHLGDNNMTLLHTLDENYQLFSLCLVKTPRYSNILVGNTYGNTIMQWNIHEYRLVATDKIKNCLIKNKNWE